MVSLRKALVVAMVSCTATMVCAATASANVFWTNSSVPSAVGEMNLDGSGVNPGFVCGPDTPVAAAVDPDSNYLYWVNGDGNTIGRSSIDGSSADESFIDLSADSPDGLTGVTAAGSYIYWVNGDGSIGRANADGSGVDDHFIASLGESWDGQGGIAVNAADTTIYWTVADYGIGGDFAIESANIDGSGAQILIGSLGNPPEGLAVDDDHIYWAEGNDILRADLDGSNVDDSFIAATDPFGVAISDSAIYWTSPETGAIGKATLNGSGAASDINASFAAVGGNPVGIAVTNAGPSSAAGSGCSSGTPGAGSGGGTTQTYTLKVEELEVAAPSGERPFAGTVTSDPAGITCPSTCSAAFPAGSEPVLTATPAAGVTFLGWSGACTGTGPCSVSMGADESVTAAFGSPGDGPPGSSGGGSSSADEGGGSTVTPAAQTLAAPPAPDGAISSGSATSGGASSVAQATDAGTTATAVGYGAVTVSQYGTDPAGAPSFSSAGQYFDVEVASGSSFSTLTVSNCNLGGGGTLDWWNGDTWQAVSPQTYTPGTPACSTAILSATSTPSIAQLTGTVFAVTLRGVVAAAKPAVSGTRVSVPVSCRGGSRSSCAITVTLTAATHKPARTIKLGTAIATIRGGRKQRIAVSLSLAGQRLLRARHTLAATLTVTSAGTTVSSAQVRFRSRRAT